MALGALIGLWLAAPAFGQQIPSPPNWQAGPGAAGDTTYVGLIEAPTNGSNVAQSGSLSLSGWFVDTTAQGWAGADDVQVFLGSMDAGVSLGRGSVGLNRPDVGSALGNPYWSAAGFSAVIDTVALPLGEDTLSVYAHSPAKGWWYTQVTVVLRGQTTSSSGEILAPAPALQGAPPLVTVDSPAEGELISTRIRSLPITGTARDSTTAARGIDWVEVWLNGEANSEHATMLGSAELKRDGAWSLPFDPGVHAPIISNLYIYAHSAVTGKTTLVVRHFSLADRPEHP